MLHTFAQYPIFSSRFSPSAIEEEATKFLARVMDRRWRTNIQPANQPARTCVRERAREKTRGNSGQQRISSFRRSPGALPGVLQVVAVGMSSKRRNLRALWFWMTYFNQLSWGQYFIHYCLGWQILKLPYLPKTDVRPFFVFIYLRKRGLAVSNLIFQYILCLYICKL
jgi:hypothetical protein